jgi:hypothetical protein
VKVILALVLLVSGCHPAKPPTMEEDARAIVGEVVTYEADLHRDVSQGATCLASSLSGIALDEQRSRLKGLEKDVRASGSDRDGLERRRAATAHPVHDWVQPPRLPRGDWSAQTPLPSSEARLLSEAAGEIIRGKESSPVIDKIDRAWLRSPLPECGKGDGRDFLWLSAPAIRGDIAFVETGFGCGELCGNGLLYALRRESDGWDVVALVDTWIS